jgi:phage repressor protein C with HTH and peptisase S24 domain
VLGWGECGTDGWSLWNGDVIDLVEMPANLRGVPGAYAVYVVGASMEPRYHPGELVHIHPGKPLTIGAYVLVQRRAKDGDTPRAVIKRLVKRTATKIVLEQFNPQKTFEIRNDDIVSVHRVVGSGEA